MVKKREIAAVVLVVTTALGGFAGSTASADAAGSASTSAAAKTTLGSVAVTPSTGLTDLKKVTVRISNYGTFTGKVTLGQCTPQVVSDPTHADQYCDTRRASVGHFRIVNGAGTGHFKVRVGRSFKAGSSTATCASGGTCLLLATTPGTNPAYAGFTQISFR